MLIYVNQRNLTLFCMKSNNLSIFGRFLTKKTDFRTKKLEDSCVKHALNMARIEVSIAEAGTAKSKQALIKQFELERDALVQASAQLEALS